MTKWKLSKVHYILPPSTTMETRDFDLELKPLIPEGDQVREVMHKIFGEKVKICVFECQGKSLGEMFDEYHKENQQKKLKTKKATK